MNATTCPVTASEPDPTRDFWPLDPTTSSALVAAYARMRHDEPVTRTTVSGRDVWLVTTHALCLEVLRNPAVYSSRAGGLGVPPSDEMKAELRSIRAALGGYPRVNTLFTADPPAHNRYRKLVSQAFSPRAIATLAPVVEETANRLVDGWIGDGHVELVTGFAEPLSLTIISHILAIPAERMDDFKRWSQATSVAQRAGVTDQARLDAERDVVELQLFFADLLAARRAEPRDDFISDLIRARVAQDDPDADAEPLSDPEILDILQQVLVAGYETTSRSLTETMMLLGNHPDRWAEICADPDRIPDVVEEGLRLASPGQGLWRRVTQDTVLGGVPIPAGARVVIMFASANRDEAVFAGPDDFAPDRANLHDQLSFGKGIHYCLGASLARLELRTAIRALTERIERFTVPEPDELAYDLSVMLRGLQSLDVRFVERQVDQAQHEPDRASGG